MSDSPDERNLRERFEELKRSDARQAPSFAASWRRPTAPDRGQQQWRWGLAVCAAAGAMIFVVLALRPPAEAPFVPEPVVYAGPLDFLLQPPGNAAISDIPSFGASRKGRNLFE